MRLSHDFQEREWGNGAIDAVRADYESTYRQYTEEISRLLGPPDGSTMPGSNNPQYDVGGGLTYWDQATGRVELALYHEGRLAPFELWLRYERDLFPL